MEEAALMEAFLRAHSLVAQELDPGEPVPLSHEAALGALMRLEAGGAPPPFAVCHVDFTHRLFPTLADASDEDLAAMQEAGRYWMLPAAMMARVAAEQAARAEGLADVDSVPPALQPVLDAAVAHAEGLLQVLGALMGNPRGPRLTVNVRGLCGKPFRLLSQQQRLWRLAAATAPEEESEEVAWARAEHLASAVLAGHELAGDPLQDGGVRLLEVAATMAAVTGRGEWAAAFADLVGFVPPAAWVAAATGGHLHLLQAFAQREPRVGVDHATAITTAAAAGGHVYVLRFLFAKGLGRVSETASAAAASSGHVEALKWLCACQGCPVGNATAVAAAARGDLPLLEWLVLHQRAPVTTEVLHAAAEGGHVPVLAWATAQAPDAAPPSKWPLGHAGVVTWLLAQGRVTVEAVEGSPLPVLQAVHGAGYALPDRVMQIALLRCDQATVAWLAAATGRRVSGEQLRQAGRPSWRRSGAEEARQRAFCAWLAATPGILHITEADLLAAVEHQPLDVVQALCAHAALECRTLALCEAALAARKFDVLAWLLANGCPRSTRLYDAALPLVSNRRTCEAFTALHTAGVPLDEGVAVATCRAGRTSAIKWLLRVSPRCPWSAEATFFAVRQSRRWGTALESWLDAQGLGCDEAAYAAWVAVNPA